MADEALNGPKDALEIGTQAGADVFAVKINQSGGLTPACLVGQLARLTGVELYGGTMLEGGVGTAATAPVVSTFPRLGFGTELFGPLLLTEEILQQPLVYRDFMLEVPTGPGIGVDIDRDKLQAMRRK